MALEQTRDIIEKARAFHHALADYYEQLEHVPQKEKVRMALEYLRRHERAMEEELRNFEANTDRALLDTWFRYSPEASEEAIARLKIRPDMSIEEVMELALKMDEQLLETYARAAQMAPAPAVREIFANLHREGLRERARFLRALNAMD